MDQFRQAFTAMKLDSIDVFVAVDEAERIAAFGALDSAKSEVVSLYVHPSIAGTGIGKLLLLCLENTARKRGLERLQLSASLNSSDFYFSQGYEFGEALKHRLRSGGELRCIGLSKALKPGARAAPSAPQMPVYLVPYDDAWPNHFELERTLILRQLGSKVRGVEHIGSTAVPGLAAKPVIDIMALVDDVSVAPSLFDALELIDYHYFPYDERRVPERRWFCKPNGLHRTHHLHLTQIGSPHHRNQILFRDHLRRHRDDATHYENLKSELARRFPHDREAYTAGKSEFVQKIIDKATHESPRS